MSNITEQISQLLSPILESTDIFLVDIVLRGERSSKVVEIYLDADNGITIEKCSFISRALSQKMEETEIITGRLTLDVSSPDLNKPIKLKRQYEKNIGRKCKLVVVNDGIRSNHEGFLESIADDVIVLKQNGKSIEFQFSKVVEMYIIPQIK